jgi:hypothetical protein
MRHAQARLVDDLVTGEDEVEIERPRRIGARPRAAVSLFDVQKRIEQLARRPRRAADTGRVQVRRIVFQARPDRRCFDQK